MNIELNRLLDTPHTLIAGTTGSGKSVLLNQVICEAYKRLCEFVFIDLKRVELARYKNTFRCEAYVTEPEDVYRTLYIADVFMENRYEEMEKKGLLKSDEPPLYIVIDELADLITYPKVLPSLVKIGRLGRAANIHLICATQDPSRNTLPAQLMQNFTCCAALRCRSAIESRQIIGIAGAESLPKHGKCIVWDADGYSRYDIPYFSQSDVEKFLEPYRN